jgi:hypothetical protein
MKKCFIGITMFLCFAGLAYSQDAKEIAIGLGVEGNQNTREGAAFGASLRADYGITGTMAAGVKATFSHDFDEISVVEPEALFRFYFMKLGSLSLFGQAGVGVGIISEESGDGGTSFLGELTAGVRIPLGSLYVEPSASFGYPFMWRAGVAVGLRIPGKSAAASEPARESAPQEATESALDAVDQMNNAFEGTGGAE